MRNTCLQLWFVGDERPELDRSEFFHSHHSECLRCIRGKTEGAFAGHGTFQWTSAVHALSLLMVRTAIVSETSSPALEGEKGSPASSLDYAVSKQTAWLLDMFGLTAEGKPMISRLLRISNPNRKRPGPVGIAVNPNQLPCSSIEIFWNNKRLLPSNEGIQLLTQLDASWNWPDRGERRTTASQTPVTENVVPPGIPLQLANRAQIALTAYIQAEQQKGQHVSPFHFPEFKEILWKLLRDELALSLRAIDIFRLSAQKRAVNRLKENTWFKKVMPKDTEILDELDFSLPSAERFGMTRETSALTAALCGDRPITLHTGTGQVGAVAIALYLKLVKGYNIELNNYYTNTMELADKICMRRLDTNRDVCSLSVGNSRPLFLSKASKDYFPLMLMPSQSFRFVSRQGATVNHDKGGHTAKPWRFCLYTGAPSTSQFYFQELMERRVIRDASSQVVHMETDDLGKINPNFDDDSQGLLWFPHGHFNVAFNSFQFSDTGLPGAKTRETVLFVPKSFREGRNVAFWLDVAIRDAWLALQSSEGLLDLMATVLVESREYVTFLARYSGMYELAPVLEARGSAPVTLSPPVAKTLLSPHGVKNKDIPSARLVGHRMRANGA